MASVRIDQNNYTDGYLAKHEDFAWATLVGSTYSNGFMNVAGAKSIVKQSGESSGLCLGDGVNGNITFTVPVKSVSLDISDSEGGSIYAIYDAVGNYLYRGILPAVADGETKRISFTAPEGESIGFMRFQDTGGVVISNMVINNPTLLPSVETSAVQYDDFAGVQVSGGEFSNNFMSTRGLQEAQAGKGLLLGASDKAGELVFAGGVSEVAFVMAQTDSGVMSIFDTEGRILETINLPKRIASVPEFIFNYEAPEGSSVGAIRFQDTGGILIENVTINSPYPVGDEGAITGANWNGERVIYNDFFARDEIIRYMESYARVGHDDMLDTLKITSHGQRLDLTRLSNKAISSIEMIDLKGDGLGVNKLTLSIEDVLHLGQRDLILENGHKQFIVNGDANDVLNVVGDTRGWQAQSTTNIGGASYTVYDNAAQNATLLVEDKVNVNLL